MAQNCNVNFHVKRLADYDKQRLMDEQICNKFCSVYKATYIIIPVYRVFAFVCILSDFYDCSSASL